MIKIEIDGKTIQAPDGAMIIEVADEVGIPIPRFCYHKHLSIAANCRMCLVEVDKVKKPVPACATPVTEGMRVSTKSKIAVDAQRGIMEFLLINHPLDCPICDQGGECDLQELSIGYGSDVSRYEENKRVVHDKDLGPLIATDMTRCIHCTRCVRFGQEVAGLMELGATGRGEHMEIGTYVEHAMTSEVSGNVIDLCPVGALTSKPYRYTARPWELTAFDGTAPHDCLGSNIQVQLRDGEVMRVLPRENNDVNLTWLSDRDRFSYQGLNSEERLTAPMIKQDGQWQETDWETALEFTAKGLHAVMTRGGGEQLGALVSPGATTEEMYLLQKLMRALGSPHIDHRLRQMDFSDQDLAPVFPSLGMPIRDIEELGAALFIGSNIRKEQPVAAIRVRKAALKGGRMMFINPVDYDFNFPVHARITGNPAEMEHALAGVAAALLKLTGLTPPEGFTTLLAGVQVTDTHTAMAQQLHKARKKAVILGNLAMAHPALATLRALGGLIASCSGASFGYLSEGANAAGGWLSGAVPHRGPGGRSAPSTGLDARTMCAADPRQGYVLFNVEADYDTADPASTLNALRSAQFVVSLSSYKNDEMLDYAHALLPVTPFSETSGTFINAEGRWQGFNGMAPPAGEARPGWKVLRVLGNFLHASGFDYVTSTDVINELRQALGGENPKSDNALQWRCPPVLSRLNGTLLRISHVPIYAVDGIVRRAPSLQETEDARQEAIYINCALARRLGLNAGQWAVARQGAGEATLPVVLDDRIPDGCVLIPSALPGTRRLGASTAEVDLRPA
jgi:NADH-quinone oxidoreductase subunit G